MRQVNIHEANRMLGKLVEAAEAGERVILTRAGRPVAQIVRLGRPGGVRLGALKGQIPAELIDAVMRPLSAKDSARRFAGDLER